MFFLVSDKLKVILYLDGNIKFCNHFGQVIREEMPPKRQGGKWVHEAKLKPEEHIYGLGERAATLNLRAAKNKQGESKSFKMWGDFGTI